jgi:1,4-alpha-glucan branching enzyme
VLRRFSRLTVTVVYSGSLDFTPPIIWEINSIIVADTATFSVSADDTSGVARVLVTTSTDGQTWRSHDLSYVPYAQLWEATLPGLTEDTSYFVQVMDGADKVTVSDNKGQYHMPQQHNLFPSVVLRESTWMVCRIDCSDQ